MNFRPLPYQGSALPLSYGSACGAEIHEGRELGKALDPRGSLDEAPARRHAPRMTEDSSKKPALSPAGERAAAARQKRLAAALRANLGRRKAQARERAEPAPAKKP